MKLIKKILKWFFIIFVIIPIVVSVVASLFGSSNDKDTEKDVRNSTKQESNSKNVLSRFQIEPKFIRNYEFLNILGQEEELPGVEFFKYDDEDPEFTGFYVLYSDGSVGEYYNIDSSGMRNVTVQKKDMDEIIETLISIKDNFVRIEEKDYSSLGGECIKQIQSIHDNEVEYSVCGYSDKGKSYSANFTYGYSLVGEANFHFSSYNINELNDMIHILSEEIKPTNKHKNLLLDHYNKINSVSVF